MTILKIAGVIVGLAALAGGGFWWFQRRKAKAAEPEARPSNPPRNPAATDREDLPPDQRPSRAETTKPIGHTVKNENLDSDLKDVLNGLFDKGGWPPDEETLNDLEKDDVIIFAVESEETGNYTQTSQELISAKVISVEKSVIRGRVFGEVKYAEHLGSRAGHGFRIGDLVEIPRSQILVAARRTDTDNIGYGSLGDPAQTLEPSNSTKRTYRVKPNTPYDIVLPYRTAELAWYIDRELVKLVHIGDKGMTEQIMFTEGSLRGPVSVRAIDEDPEVGSVFVARWDFVIES